MERGFGSAAGGQEYRGIGIRIWDDERSNDERSNDERSNDERSNNERSNNVRSNTERSNNERSNNEMSNITYLGDAGHGRPKRRDANGMVRSIYRCKGNNDSRCCTTIQSLLPAQL